MISDWGRSSSPISEFRAAAFPRIQLVELQLERLGIPILRVLDHEDHQKRHDRGACVDHELPGIRPAEKRAGYSPQDDAQARRYEYSGMTELMLGPAREAVKNQGHCFGGSRAGEH